MSMELTPLTLTLWGLLGCFVVMTLTWIMATRLNFFSLVDAVWAIGIGLLALIYLVGFGNNSLRSVVLISLILFWSLRLSGHLLKRIVGHFPKEDSRYEKLKKNWSFGESTFKKKSFIFFQFQALTQAIFAYPFAVAALDNSHFPKANEIIGLSLSLIGIMGEGLADWQLKQFKRIKENKDKVCNVGLWNYSRHPNYFFEWVVWCGFGIMAFTAPWGKYALFCPLFMLVLLLFVTGVQPSEEQALKSRGQAYRQYQKTTSRFIPWPPKKEFLNDC